MTHGHNHHVKQTRLRLVADARAAGAAAALYGHTHEPDCQQLEDGLWLLNPGACGSSGGSVAVIETEGNKIKACRHLVQADLMALV
jgi:predicted phosphodiesterase